MVKSSQIIDFLENSFTDISKQSSWDFSGKQVFTGDKNISKVALSLDPTRYIIEKAIKEGCELLITHHPLFFRSRKGLNIQNLDDEKAVIAIRGGLDIISCHTNLDIADKGTNYYICKLLGFQIENDTLSVEGKFTLYKFSVFVPYDYKDKVFNAITLAGAGKIGNYSACGFIAEGAGLFTPDINANPFIGNNNEPEIVDEVKIETIVYEKDLKKVLKALKESHPYEEPAFDVILLENSLEYGFGKICTMDREYSLKEFIEIIKNRLNIKDIRTNMLNIEPFNKFAVCTGSGVSLWKNAKNKGIKVLLSGDMKYHEAMDAMDNGICVIDAGHQGTEELYMDYLAEVLKEKFQIEIKVYKQNPQIYYWGNN